MSFSGAHPKKLTRFCLPGRHRLCQHAPMEAKVILATALLVLTTWLLYKLAAWLELRK